MKTKWIDWSQRLSAIAQNGLNYSESPFDKERYSSVREIAAEIMAEYSGSNKPYILDLLSGELGHATPKVDVRGAVFQDGKILLVREREDGMWTLPGGWADVDESPSEAVVREIYEESGYHTEVVKLLALYDRSRHGHPPYPFAVYMLFFMAKEISSSPVQSIETDKVGFFGPTELPTLSVNRVTPKQLEMLFELYKKPDSQTIYD
jgi:ADP-ribose pyrophosphatase YjhB (NUDIX family)